MSLYLYTFFGCLCGGALNGVAGFGAVLVMMPLLLLFMGMDTAVPLSVLCGIALQSMGVALYREHITGSALLPMLIGSLPGAWMGSVFLFHLPEFELRTILGILLAAYGLLCLLGGYSPPKRAPAKIWAYTAGFFSGAFGGAFGITGPPAALYATRTGWTPDEIRGRLNAFFSLLYIAIFLAQFAQGLFTAEVWRLAAVGVPACLLSSLCSRHITGRLLPAQYMRIIFLMLFAMGLSLCRPALFRLFA